MSWTKAKQTAHPDHTPDGSLVPLPTLFIEFELQVLSDGSDGKKKKKKVKYHNLPDAHRVLLDVWPLAVRASVKKSLCKFKINSAGVLKQTL